jgi:hypothetical protein
VTTRPLLLVLVLAATAGACGNEEDVRDPVWGYISPAIIQPNCATSSCHSKASAVAGLDLSSDETGYKSLLGLTLGVRPASMKAPPRPMVIKFNPDESRMLHMLKADGARRMPPDRPLAGADIALVEQWILLGAQDN